ncbi:hypothetical protein BCV70DRAFT_118764 [Testicularia cyperi]|uniref:Bacterial surface antigen (D15) domain-containing protein n=1 Tax=Testicularia cyperi TaxID=1882483 RepID=A0A317XNN1_9BASI|nr:hypothetical protein BCV70DRAFT_118764 [Testicularia cyperi]
MEFESLKEQHRGLGASEADARAASKSASDASEASGSSSRARKSRQAQSGTDHSQPGPSPTPAEASASTPFGRAMADPTHSISSAEPHSQPFEDGDLPTSPGLGAEHGAGEAQIPDPSPLDMGTQDEIEAEPLRPHNLLRATEVLQSAAPVSPFAPAPILRLNMIQIGGKSGALRPSFLASLCRPYMDPSRSLQNPNASHLVNSLLYGHRTSHVLPGQPTTLPSILSLTSSLASDLDKLDVFNGIEATLAPSVFPGSTEEDVDIILNCGKPKGRVFLKSSTDVGNGEGSASIQGRIRNVFGGAETLQGSASFGTRTKRAFNLEFGAPIPGNVDNEMKLSMFSLERDLSAFASCFESVQGVKTALSTSRSSESLGSLDPEEAAMQGLPNLTVQYELAYEASLRQLSNLLPDASIAIRKSAVTPSVKSALSWTATRDSRDDPVLPTRGSFWKTVLEYAGLGGDAQHVKAEFETHTGRQYDPLNLLFGSSSSKTEAPLAPEAGIEKPALTKDERDVSDEVAHLTGSFWGPINTSLGVRGGFLHSLSSTGAQSHFSDRFQLGGPTTLRMFRLNSLGPKARGDSLGGDAYWAVGGSVLTPIPGKLHWPLKLHGFANAGQMCQLAPQLGTGKGGIGSIDIGGLRELLQPSSSVGFGLVYLQGQLRVEFNAGLPITARKGDGMRKGLQFGIGIQFL